MIAGIAAPIRLSMYDSRKADAMNSPVAHIPHVTVNGSEGDIRTAKAVLAWLRPRCPRCARLDVTPMTWYEDVIWFQCRSCYKLWQERFSGYGVSTQSAIRQDSTHPETRAA